MVYVIQEQKGKNLLPALKFGQIKVLLDQNVQVGFSAGQVTRELDAKLSNFNDSDFLLLMGDPVLIGLSTALAAKWNKGKVAMLKWDRQENVYYQVSINLYEKGDSNGQRFA